MQPGRILFAMLEPVIDKSLRDIAGNPQRAVRSLLDTALPLLRDSDRAEFLRQLRCALDDDSCAYFPLLQRLALGVDQRYIKTTAGNVVCNSMSGRKKLKALEETLGHGVPRSLLLDLRQAAMPLQRLDALITQGEQMGIFQYLLWAGKGSAPRSLVRLVEKHGGSTFALLTSPALLGQKETEVLSAASNTAVALQLDGPLNLEELAACTQHLVQCGVFYGCCSTYTGMPAHIEEHLETCRALGMAFCLYLPGEGVSSANVASTGRKVMELLQRGAHAILPLHPPTGEDSGVPLLHLEGDTARYFGTPAAQAVNVAEQPLDRIVRLLPAPPR